MLSEIAKHTDKFFYFYEVASEGSIQATARRIGITAPSLSTSIKQLEQILGAELFLRSKSGMKLTDAGDKLFSFCRKYFRELSEVEHLINHPGIDQTTKIRVGTFQSIAIYFVPLLFDILKNSPQISLSLKTNRSKNILESLVRKEIDLALTVEDFKHERLIKHELYKDEYALYGTREITPGTLSRAAARNFSLLYIPDAVDENGKSLRSYLHGWEYIFKEEFELDSLEVICEFIKRGYGIGVLPTKVAKSYGRELRPIKLSEVGITRFGPHRFFLSYRDDLELPQRLLLKVLDAAKTAVNELNS